MEAWKAFWQQLEVLSDKSLEDLKSEVWKAFIRLGSKYFSKKIHRITFGKPYMPPVAEWLRRDRRTHSKNNPSPRHVTWSSCFVFAFSNNRVDNCITTSQSAYDNMTTCCCCYVFLSFRRNPHGDDKPSSRELPLDEECDKRCNHTDGIPFKERLRRLHCKQDGSRCALTRSHKIKPSAEECAIVWMGL